ncbi:hypothetical protein Tco_0857315 [Tanacetum coccineum]|uniref:Uncharacterized protein n=1 Tax=Tanacetum coccineum TaxID=301880 RepID=A0ABQ5B8Y5_9ASTR
MVLGIKASEVQDKSVVVIIMGKRVTSLVSFQSSRRTRRLSVKLRVTVKTTMYHKKTQHVSWRSTLKRCDILIQEVDSLKTNVSKLQDEALSFSRFKKSSVVLDDMLSRQNFPKIRKVLDFQEMGKPLLMEMYLLDDEDDSDSMVVPQTPGEEIRTRVDIISQEHRKGDALDPRLKISTLYLYKDIYLQVKDQDPAFSIRKKARKNAMS